MKLAFRDIDAFAKKPNPKALAVLIYGPDEGLVRERMTLLTKNIVPDVNDPFNVVDITGGSLGDNPSRVLDEAQAISMLGGRRVVRVRDGGDGLASTLKDVLTALREGDNLVLIEAGELGPRSSLRLLFEEAENAVALPCYVDDERDIGKVIAEGLKAANFRISSDALTFMSANVVGDRAVARGEVEKLITYMGSTSKDIGLDDVTACIGESAALPLDDLVRHIGNGQFAEADRVLNILLARDVFPVTILRTLQTHFWRLHITKARLEKGDRLESALMALRPPLFFKNKPAFENQVMSLSQAQLEQTLNIIISAEARCKQSGSMPDLIVGRAVMALCQLIARASARRRA